MRTASIAAAAVATLAALFMLCVAWEWRVAPLRPGGSWLVLKALPLLAALPGVIRGRPYTYRWASLLVIGYFAEGMVRAFSEGGAARALAALEVALALAFYCLAVAYVRRVRAGG